MKTLWHEEPSSYDRVANPGPGMPAPCWPKNSLASFESENGKILILDCWVTKYDDGTPRFLPGMWGFAVSRAQDEALCPLWDDPDARWVWRPLLYQMRWDTSILRLGSQQELEWRHGVWMATLDRLSGEFMSAYLDANERAERILIEHLCPQQRLDLAAHRKFYVQGRLNKLYEVEISNGFAIVHPETREIIVKHCCHPEYWMPHADVALATKLAIEAGEDSEAELLQAGRSTLRQHRFRSTREERRAWEMEKHLL